MATTTTNRKELFHTIKEVTKELRKKINSVKSYDDDGSGEYIQLGHRDQTVKWIKEKESLKDAKDTLGKAENSPDSEPYHSFNYETDHGLLIGLSWIRIVDTHGNLTNGNKIIPIVVVGSHAEQSTIILRTNLTWYDHLRPSIISLKRLINHARRMRVKHKAIAIEHHLAKIIPDRIDKILLEGDNGGKDRNS